MKKLTTSDRPFFFVNKTNWMLEIRSGNKVLKSYPIPAVVQKFTGDTRDRVLREEVDKMRNQYGSDLGKLQYAWDKQQPLTRADKIYIKIYIDWKKKAESLGVQHPDAESLYKQMEDYNAHVTPAGWDAIDKLNKARS